MQPLWVAPVRSITFWFKAQMELRRMLLMKRPVDGIRHRWAQVLLVTGALIWLLAGCVYPTDYQDWKWKQWNPNYVPLPGDPPH